MRRLFIACLIAGNALTAGAQLKINELMQSNVDVEFDNELNDFPDSWVEIYNEGDAAVDIAGYRIGIKDNFSKAYQLPSIVVEPKGYALIYCDKEATGRHTDFRLESGKDGAVFFYDRAGNVVDKITGMKKQPAPNIAYGRETDGAAKWGYQLKATPGAGNSGGISSNLLPDPVFSMLGGVFEKSSRMKLILSLPENAPAGAVIRYTKDGSEPTESSALFSNYIIVNKSTVIRAKLFCDGYLTAPSLTQSYIFLGREQTLPVVSIVTDSRYFFDNEIGIYVEGTFNDDKMNYQYNWRRPANVEFFMEKDHQADINQIVETRVAGAASRGISLRSLVVYANKRFGTKRLDYEFFPTQRPGKKDFKSVMLRNAGNDFDYMYFRDAAIQHNMAMNADLDWQAWRPAIFYLNGEYKGMLNIRERSNEDNIYTNYNGLEDIDMIENWWELKSGTWANYDSFKNYYSDGAHTNAAEYEKWMDVTEFANLMIMNIFHNNLDFPGNNIVMWRPTAEGGKWRWVAKDTDFGLGLYGRTHEYRYIDWLYDRNFDPENNWANSADNTRLFRRLMADDAFKHSFVERMCIYMGDFLNGRGLGETIDSMNNVIKTEYPYHRVLFNKWWPNHEEEVNKAKDWAEKRTDFMYSYLDSYFSMGGYTSLLINDGLSAEESRRLNVTFNDIRLSKGYFDGMFFLNRMVNITGECRDESKEVKGWEVATEYGSTVETKTFEGKTLSMSMPSCTSVSINAIIGESSGIKSTTEKNDLHISVDGNVVSIKPLRNPARISIFDASGQSHATGTVAAGGFSWKAPHSGIYIIRVGETTKKVVVR